MQDNEASRLRALAAKARRLARSLSMTEDRARLLDLAREHEAKAEAMEMGAGALTRPDPAAQAMEGEAGRGREG